MKRSVILGSALAPILASAAGPADKPNFVFILADDLGGRDLGCYGSTFHETPHLDQLAREGVRFTDAYAACPVCSPTRASILTGQYPARLHLTNWIPGEASRPTDKLRPPAWQKFLPLSETTLATALKNAGYATAMIGKWHLGGEAYYPEHQGFDVNIAGSHWGQPASYFWPYEGQTHTVAGLKEGGKPGEYLTDRLTSEAEAFITKHRNEPFFLYLSHYAVHQPLMAKEDLVSKYKAKGATGAQKNPVYAAMIESVDESVGRILARLDALGLSEKTVVVFFSDNGGLWPDATSNAPLRAGKGYPYEGGVREPLIIKWPGAALNGSTCSVPVVSTDFFPTFLEMAGVKAPGGGDGVSLAPLLQRTGTIERDAIYWHYPHYWAGRVKPFGAVRAGDWKLIEYYEDMKVELYNLKDDIGEKNDMALQNPQKANELKEKLHAWRSAVSAQMPTPNGEGSLIRSH